MRRCSRTSRRCGSPTTRACSRWTRAMALATSASPQLEFCRPRRPRRAYRELIVTTPGNVALFSHGEFGRVLPARWIGATAVEGRHFALDTAFLSILGYEPSHPETPVIALLERCP